MPQFERTVTHLGQHPAFIGGEHSAVVIVNERAEADARRVEIAAQADATAARLVAEATATHGGIILERMLVEQYPEVARAVAAELANAHITLFDGANGLSALTAGVIGQGGAVFEALRRAMGQAPTSPARWNGAAGPVETAVAEQGDQAGATRAG